MDHTNLIFAWIWICVGLIVGAGIGLGFHRDDWMGGYGSWRRRLIRLGHVAFLGTAALNLAFAWTVRLFDLAPAIVALSGTLLIIGALTMPTVCFLAAWRPGWRMLFAVPVIALLGGTGLLTASLILADLQGGAP